MAATDRTGSIHVDARPLGPNGPLADERILGQTLLEQIVTAVRPSQPGRLVVHHHPHLQPRSAPDLGSIELTDQPPDGSGLTLRTDRLYDPRKLRRAIRSGRDPESAVLWRLDSPNGIRDAEAELVRRRTYQPLGKYWAWPPARALAQFLAPTRVRPNAVTIAAAVFMVASAAWVSLGRTSLFGNVAVAAGLAIALVLDTADGRLARLQGTASAFGRWLDEILDESADMILHAAIAWGAWQKTNQPIWIMLGMTYGMGKYLFRVAIESSTSTGAANAGANVAVEPIQSSLLRRCVRLAGHADVRWHLWIVLALAGRLELALAAYAIYFPGRAGAVLVGKAIRHASR